MKAKKLLLKTRSICVALILLTFFPIIAIGFPLHQKFENKLFPGDRIEEVDPQPLTMTQWTLVAKIRPSEASAIGEKKTILTNDQSGWNNDVLFGISPEGAGISEPGRWAIIHQDETENRTIACANNEPIEPCQWYHVAASSDGENLRLYVDGQLVAGPVAKSGASLDYRGVDEPYGGVESYVGGSVVGGGRYFDGEIEYVQIYPMALAAGNISDLFDLSRNGVKKSNLGIKGGLYTRTVNIGDNDTIGNKGKVYVVDSSFADEGVYEIVEFDSESVNNKSYPYIGDSTLNDVEFYCGQEPESCWWYGTTFEGGLRVFRWRDWADFDSQNWQGIVDKTDYICYHGYFLTKLNDMLFVACYGDSTDGIYEIKDAGGAEPYLEEYVPKDLNNGITLSTVTSIDFCNGNEIITDLDHDRFVYRGIGEGENDWKVSDEGLGLDRQHSITCGLTDDNKRYFVADSDHHRIISFAHLDKPFCNEPNNPNCSCESGDTECQPYREFNHVIPPPDDDPNKGFMCRPHDLKYNPFDGYFYGVTAPYKTDCTNTYLFRFKDIDPDGTVVEGGFLDLTNLGNIVEFPFPLHQKFENKLFPGDRIEEVDPQPLIMTQWTLVAKIRPSEASAIGEKKTILTNDQSGWNNDVLFGISPEGAGISEPGRWAIIHQDETKNRTIACAINTEIEQDRWYNVAASSDGENLRLYVDGQLVAGPVAKTGASLDYHGVKSYVGGSKVGGSGCRYFDGEIEYVQIYPIAINRTPVARCSDVIITTDDQCQSNASIDDGSFDPDNDQITIIQEPVEPYPLGDTSVTLTVTDDRDALDTCIATVNLVETTPPEIECNVPPSITPSDVPISFTASATDNCDELSVEITAYDCWTINAAGKRIDKKKSCLVSLAGDTVTISDSGGVGDHIEWTVLATDYSGNTIEADCAIEVVNPGNGGKN